MLATSTANTSTGVPTKHPLTVRAWTPGQHPTTLDYCMTQREQPVSPLTGETSAPALCGQTMYPTWTSQELCAVLAQRVRDPLSHRFIRATVGTDSDRAASSLLFRLQQKKQKRWEETVNSIDFSHSNRKAWRIINKLTGTYGHSFHQCPISANSIASQLVKNGAHKTKDRKSTWLVNKELSDLWKIPTPEVHSISEPFRPEELAVALRRLKPA